MCAIYINAKNAILSPLGPRYACLPHAMACPVLALHTLGALSCPTVVLVLGFRFCVASPRLRAVSAEDGLHFSHTHISHSRHLLLPTHHRRQRAPVARGGGDAATNRLSCAIFIATPRILVRSVLSSAALAIHVLLARRSVEFLIARMARR